MSLFGSLQNAGNTLQAMQIGMAVTGNNIANANTEGFIRERVNYAPAPVLKKGNLSIGLGVIIDSLTQVIDDNLARQLNSATGDRVSAELQNEAYKDLERLLGELTDTDLSTALTDFFGSIEDTLNPASGEDLSVRNLAILEGKQLANEIQRIDERAKQMRDDYNQQIIDAAGQINQLTSRVLDLNIRITQIEGGGAGNSDAGALRTERNAAVNDLAELLDIDVIEQPSGGLSISVGGEFLVFEGQKREIQVLDGSVGGEPAATLQFADTQTELDINRGLVHGLTAARDEIVGGFRSSFDEFAQTLIFEFNKTFSGGQGLNGFTELTSADAVSDPSAALNAAGLAFSPVDGDFNITLVNTSTGDTETTKINVQLLGQPDDTSLNDLASQINAISGLTSSVNTEGRLVISADAPDSEFYFSGDQISGQPYQGDTSNVLAALGLNTFFTGSGSSSISVNNELDGIENASKFAASNTGLGAGTGNAVALSQLIDEPLAALDGASIVDKYDQVVNELAQNSTVAGSLAEGLATFEGTLSSEFQAISGVNIDEEAIELITLQHIYQATARYIATIQEMLETLVRL